jgi:hypothetical protein
MFYGKEIMLYNANTMSEINKRNLTRISETDYIDLMVDTCSQVICFEYKPKLCNCKMPRDCHGYKDYTEAARSCIGIINAFGESIFSVEFDKKKLN